MKSKDYIEFYEQRVYDLLNKDGISFKKEVNVGGTTSDLFFEAPTGGTVVVNFKNWEPTDLNLKIASDYAKSIKKASGADYSYVFLPEFDPELLFRGVASINNFGQIISSLPPKKSKKKPPIVTPDHSDKNVFAAMPFSKQYNDTYIFAIKPACQVINAKCVRVDQQSSSGDIVTEIKKEIKKCRILIADVSESKPNVLYEMGIGEGLGKKIIQICSTELSELPFDIRNNRTIKYQIGDVLDLQTLLSEELKRIIGNPK